MHMMMKRTCSILVGMVLLASCSGVKVITDSQSKVDHSKYQTYNFIGWQEVSDELFTKSDIQLMEDSFIREFERRGLKRGNAKADMQISCYLVTSTEAAFSGYTDYVGRRGSGFDHYSGGYGYGYRGNTSKIRSQLTGTLIMNVYDTKTNKQIWQAVASGKVNDNPKTDRSKTIPKKVATVMRRFPFKQN